jgi:hypothetical protein
MALRSRRAEVIPEDEALVPSVTHELRAQRPTKPRLIALCVAMFLLNAALNVLLLRQMDAPRGKTSDFAAFYTAGKIVAEGSGKGLYDLDTQTSTQLRSTPYKGQPLLYYHPAFETLLFAPLALLPYQKAYLLWNGINVLVLLSIPIILRKHLRLIDHNLALSVLALASFFPVFITLHQGQDSILLLLCYAMAFAAMRSQQDFRAGIFLALALFKFQFVLPFVVLLSLIKRWSVIKGFVATAIALAAVSLAVTGVAGLWEFPHFLWNANQHWTLGNISPAEMANLRGVIASAMGTSLSTKSAVLICSVLLFAATAFITRRSVSREKIDLTFAMMVLVTMMVSYHLNPHDLTLLVLPIALGINHLVIRSASPLNRSVIIISSLVLLSTPVYLLLLSRQRLYLLFWAILVFALAVAKGATEAFGAISTNRPATKLI